MNIPAINLIESYMDFLQKHCNSFHVCAQYKMAGNNTSWYVHGTLFGKFKFINPVSSNTSTSFQFLNDTA